MSIVPLEKATIYGLSAEKEEVLRDLQEMGFLHIIPLKVGGREGKSEGPTPQAREALKYLLSCRQRRKQVHRTGQFDAEAVERRALEIKEKIHDLGNERDFLRDRINDVTPWGDFDFPSLHALKNLRLWFYLVEHKEIKKLKETDLTWAIVKRDASYSYVIVIAEREPHGVPAPRVHVGSRSLSQLEQRLDEVEIELEDLQAERFALTRWCDLYARSLHQMEDKEQLAHANQQTLDDDPLFALQAWAPHEKIAPLRTYTDNKQLAIVTEQPHAEEVPPTLLKNPTKLASGQDLLSFYITPNYWLSDPSIIIFFSFILFFAMILGDTGYGLVMAAGLLLGWARMGKSETGRRMRILLGAIVGTTIVWGMLVGSYFGVTPSEGSLLAGFKIFDLNNYQTMMMVSIGIGALHIMMANGMDIFRKGISSASLAPLGWIVLIISALLMGTAGDNQSLYHIGTGLLIAGLLLVLLFSGAGKKAGKRVLSGLYGLTKITSAFGDILSYLRLFALGLATSSLAIAFNDLASQVSDSAPGVGLLFALVILFIGHLLNLVLGIVSGVVHGLRLNLIEFLNWSIPEEGFPFRAFARKEDTTWNR
jgi:V/A-type H+-transporting ATPase subunit I